VRRQWGGEHKKKGDSVLLASGADGQVMHAGKIS